MPPRNEHRKSTYTTRNDEQPVQRCEQCKHQDPAARYNHWLEFDSVDDLEEHVSLYIKLEDDRFAILRGYRDCRENWSGLVHPMTGAPMHWREARHWAFKEARTRQDLRLQELAAKHHHNTAAAEPITVAAEGEDDEQLPF